MVAVGPLPSGADPPTISSTSFPPHFVNLPGSSTPLAGWQDKLAACVQDAKDVPLLACA